MTGSSFGGRQVLRQNCGCRVSLFLTVAQEAESRFELTLIVRVVAHQQRQMQDMRPQTNSFRNDLESVALSAALKVVLVVPIFQGEPVSLADYHECSDFTLLRGKKGGKTRDSPSPIKPMSQISCFSEM